MWRHVSTYRIILRPIIEPRLRCTSSESAHFGIPKCLQHQDNMYTNEVGITVIIIIITLKHIHVFLKKVLELAV